MLTLKVSKIGYLLEIYQILKDATNQFFIINTSENILL